VEAQQVTNGFGVPLKMHPSGLTLKEWSYPYKTPEQMVLMMGWYKQQQGEDPFDPLLFIQKKGVPKQ
jgi:hypothetical protein